MPLSRALEEKLSKTYAASATLDDTFRGLDLTFVTNDQGEPVTLFLGRRRPDGAIAGERYVRTIKRAADGVAVASSHWDLKGKVARR